MRRIMKNDQEFLDTSRTHVSNSGLEKIMEWCISQDINEIIESSYASELMSPRKRDRRKCEDRNMLILLATTNVIYQIFDDEYDIWFDV